MQYLREKHQFFCSLERKINYTCRKWPVVWLTPLIVLILLTAGSESAQENTAEPNSIIANGAELKLVSNDFEFTEGPAVDSEGNIYFTDQPNNKIHKWSTEGIISVFHESPGRANGLFFDKEGNLYACADEKNQLWKIDKDKNVTVLVKDYNGKLLNGPNDLWISPGGVIYFTDPFFQRDYWDRGPAEQENGEQVYCLNPDSKTLKQITEDLRKPNGIIGTPDGKILYIADMGARTTYKYKINDDGTITDKQPFCSMASDGMTIDNQGNIYLTGRGVTVFNSSGEQIEHIEVGGGWTSNVCFGGKERQTLFITSQKSVYTLEMNVKGVQ